MRPNPQFPVVLSALFSLGGCGDPGTANTVPDRPPGSPASIAITPSSLQLYAGQGWQMAAVVLDAEGRPASADVAWSSSDEQVAFIRADGVVMTGDTGHAVLTATAAGLTAFAGVSVLPAGGSLLAHTRLTATSFPYAISSDLFVLGLESPIQALVAGSRTLSIIAPALSPDGSRIAVTAIPGPVGQGAGFPGQGVRGFEEPSDLFVLPFLNATPPLWTRLTVDGWSRFPDWSPDGLRLVYVAGPPEANHIQVLRLGLVAEQPPTRITSVPGRYAMPRWSPDGSRIAFSATVLNERPDVFVMNADGSGLVNVTHNPAADAAPSWSPDGRQLAFSSDRDGPYDDIYVITLDTGAVRRVTLQDPAVSNEQPSWSPDGAQIAFSRIGPEEELVPGIYLVTVDGATVIQLTAPTDGFTDHFPAWKRQRAR